MDIIDELGKNGRIMEAVDIFQKNPVRDNLYRLMTVIASRAKQGGMWMAPVGQKDLYGMVRTDDGKSWYAAYTDVAQSEHDTETSIINVPILQHLSEIMKSDRAEGLLLNPWTQGMPVPKSWLQAILNVLAAE